MWRKRHVFMAEDGGSSAGGTTSSEGGAAPAGGGATDPNAAGGAAGATGAATGSVLATGAAGASGTSDFIPEKYRVAKDDGTLDLEASARKLADAHASAEKRIGSGDLPPKAAEEYAVAVPEALKESWKPEEDQKFIDFRSKALEAGMTQKQMDLVMASYFEMAPALVAGAVALDANACTEELKKTWATDASFKLNVGNAYVGTAAIARKAGLNIDEIMAPTALGNNPMFLKLMAAIGPEFAEDSAPGGSGMVSEEDINTLMSSEAYRNPKHPEFAKTSAKVKAYWDRKAGTEAAA